MSDQNEKLDKVMVFTVSLDNPAYKSSGKLAYRPTTAKANNEPVFIRADVVLKSDFDSLKSDLEKLVRFYGDRKNWYNGNSTASNQKQTINGDVDWCSFYEEDIYCAGKLARQIADKYGVKL